MYIPAYIKNKRDLGKVPCVPCVPYRSAWVESVHTALAALVPMSKLPPRRSKPFTWLLSRRSSWMDTGWMTGFPRLSSSSGTGSALSSSPGSVTATACCVWVIARGGCKLPSLKWVCSSELTYSITLKCSEIVRGYVSVLGGKSLLSSANCIWKTYGLPSLKLSVTY